MKYNRDLARENKELATLNKRTIDTINKNSSGSITQFHGELKNLNRQYQPSMEDIKSLTYEKAEFKKKQKQQYEMLKNQQADKNYAKKQEVLMKEQEK